MKNGFKTVDIAYIGLFVALIAVCSWISIKTPWNVAFTLQTFAVFAAVGTLGLLRGTVAVIVYILLGLVGVPVFSSFGAGASVLFGTTGGYIVGFIFSALAAGAVMKVFGKKTWSMALGMVLGLVLCYVFGTIWFMILYAKSKGAIGVMTALGWCVIPYIIPDLLKIALAIFVSKKVGKALNKDK